MGIAVSILASVAASALFYFVEPHLFALEQPSKAIGTIGVFVLSVGLAFFLQRKGVAPDGPKSSVMSENEVQGDLKAKINELGLDHATESKVLSGNKIGGNAIIEINKSRL